MMTSFGGWLKQRRKAHGWSQQELGQRVGCSAALIRKIEANERRPSREVALLIIQQVSAAGEDRDALLHLARVPLGRLDSTATNPDIILPLSPLTERERDILNLIQADLADSTIAERLFLKISTVRWYVKQIYSKLGIHNRDEAMAYTGAVDGISTSPELEFAAANTDAARSVRHRTNSLPLEIANRYVGRSQETSELTTLLRARTRLASVYGRSGIGKTALACKVLADLLASTDPPDGVVSLRLTTTGLSLFQVLSGFARLLGGEIERRLLLLTQDSETSTLQKSHLLLNMLQTGWYILLLDNLETLQHPQTGELLDSDLGALFQAVLERGGLCILSTSQQQLTLSRTQTPSERRLQLYDGLSEEEAIVLLRQCDPDGEIGLRDAPDGVLRRCVASARGYPRALEAVAGILLEDPLLTVEQLFQDPMWLNLELTAIVGHTIQRLDPLAIQVMQALSVFPHAVPFDALAQLLAEVLDTITLHSVLSHLVRGYFVHFTRVDGLFSLHPLDHDNAYHMIPSNDGAMLSRRTLHRRAADYFRQQRRPQAEWLTPSDVIPVLDEFEQWMRLEDYDEAARLLLFIDRDYLWEWGQHGLLQALHDRLSGCIIDSALRRQHRRRTAWLLWRTDVDSAARIFEEMLHDARASGDRQAEADALDDLAQDSRRRNDWLKGLNYHQQALALYREIGDRRGQAEALGGVGSVLVYLDPDTALPMIREALNFHRDMHTTASYSYVLLMMGTAHGALGEVELARTYLLEVIDLSRQRGLKGRESETIGYLSIVEFMAGNYEALAGLARQMVAIAAEFTSTTSQPYWTVLAEMGGHQMLGNAQFRLGQHEAGIASLRRAFEIAVLSQFPARVAAIGSRLVISLLASHQYAEAINVSQRIDTPFQPGDPSFVAPYIAAQIVAGQESLPFVEKVLAGYSQLPRRGRIPLYHQYALTFLKIVSDFLRGSDLAQRVQEVAELLGRAALPGLVDDFLSLLGVLVAQPGGERLGPIHKMLLESRRAKATG
jgi:DNA-binding CsgD family transcriptional regulator/tetratricopeptide (TPR) repeat protein/DNA-binding XRE family transcriptional regulator